MVTIETPSGKMTVRPENVRVGDVVVDDGRLADGDRMTTRETPTPSADELFGSRQQVEQQLKTFREQGRQAFERQVQQLRQAEQQRLQAERIRIQSEQKEANKQARLKFEQTQRLAKTQQQQQEAEQQFFQEQNLAQLEAQEKRQQAGISKTVTPRQFREQKGVVVTKEGEARQRFETRERIREDIGVFKDGGLARQDSETRAIGLGRLDTEVRSKDLRLVPSIFASGFDKTSDFFKTHRSPQGVIGDVLKDIGYKPKGWISDIERTRLKTEPDKMPVIYFGEKLYKGISDTFKDIKDPKSKVKQKLVSTIETKTPFLFDFMKTHKPPQEVVIDKISLDYFKEHRSPQQVSQDFFARTTPPQEYKFTTGLVGSLKEVNVPLFFGAGTTPVKTPIGMISDIETARLREAKDKTSRQFFTEKLLESQPITRDIKTAFKESKQPIFRDFFIEKLGAGYKEVGTDIAEVSLYKDSQLFAKAKDPSFQFQPTSRIVGKGVGTVGKFGLFAVPVVGETLFAEPLITRGIIGGGELQKFAKGHPIETGLIVGGGAFLTASKLSKLSQQLKTTKKLESEIKFISEGLSKEQFAFKGISKAEEKTSREILKGTRSFEGATQEVSIEGVTQVSKEGVKEFISEGVGELIQTGKLQTLKELGKPSDFVSLGKLDISSAGILLKSTKEGSFVFGLGETKNVFTSSLFYDAKQLSKLSKRRVIKPQFLKDLKIFAPTTTEAKAYQMGKDWQKQLIKNIQIGGEVTRKPFIATSKRIPTSIVQDKSTFLVKSKSLDKISLDIGADAKRYALRLGLDFDAGATGVVKLEKELGEVLFDTGVKKKGVGYTLGGAREQKTVSKVTSLTSTDLNQITKDLSKNLKQVAVKDLSSISTPSQEGVSKSIFAGKGIYEKFSPSELIFVTPRREPVVDGGLGTNKFDDVGLGSGGMDSLTGSGRIGSLGVSTSGRIKEGLDNLTKTGIKGISGISPKVNTDELTRSRQERALRISQAQRETQKIKQQQKETGRGFFLNFRTPPIKIPEDPIKTPFPKLKFGKGVRKKKKRGLFLVEERRRGKFKPIFKTPSLKKAFEVGRGRVARTLAATFRIKTADKLKTPRGFTQKKGGIFIEKRKFRLSKRGEKLEIQKARKAKKKKKKSKGGKK